MFHKRKSYGRYAKRAVYGLLGAGAAYLKGRKRVSRASRVSTAKRFRGAGSRTQTKRKRSNANAGNPAGNVSYFTVKRRMPKGIGSVLKMTPKQMTLVNDSGRVSGTPGKQSLGITGFYYQFAKHGSNVGFTDRGSSVSGDGVSLLKHCVSRTRFINQCPATCEMVIYDIALKIDNMGGQADPLQVWQQGMSDMTGGASGDCNLVNTFPTDSPYFSRMCKILKRRKVILAAGEVHEHAVYIQPNKIIRYDTYSNEPYGLRGLAFFTLIQVTGFPDNDSTTKTSVSSAQTAIDWVTSYRYHWQLVNTGKSYTANTNNLVTSYAVGEEVMQEFVGNVASVVAS